MSKFKENQKATVCQSHQPDRLQLMKFSIHSSRFAVHQVNVNEIC